MSKQGKNRGNFILGTLLLVLVSMMYLPMTVYAAPAESYFGSESYSPDYGAEFPIGIYLEAEESIGEYEIVLSYDTDYLEYVSGATVGGEGELVITGSLLRKKGRCLMNFNALTSGYTELVVKSVTAKNTAGDEAFTFEILPIAPINIMPGDAVVPEQLYINGNPIENFTKQSNKYSLFLSPVEEISVTDENGQALQVEIEDVNEYKKNVYATYETEEVKVIYTLYLTFTEADKITEDDKELTFEEEMQAAVELTPEKYDAMQESIKRSRMSEMLKAGAFIVLLVIIFAATLVFDIRQQRE